MRNFVGPIPQRISALKRDHRGFPIPFFVAWIDGEPHFPVVDTAKLRTCMRHDKCWICGGGLGGYKAFVIGPMCCVNRVTSEPPSHLDCARFAALNCPFLSQPKAKRFVTQDGTAIISPPGIMIERNPGVSAVWVTKSYKVERHGDGVLFRIGPASKLEFYAKSRKARRDEVGESVRTGLPALRKVAALEGPAALADFQRQVYGFTDLLETVSWDDPLPDVDLTELFDERVPL